MKKNNLIIITLLIIALAVIVAMPAQSQFSSSEQKQLEQLNQTTQKILSELTTIRRDLQRR